MPGVSKKLKRLIVGAAALSLAVPLAACSSSGGSASAGNAKEITLLSDGTPGSPGDKAFDGIISNFEKQTGIKVKVTELGEKLPQEYETSLEAGKEQDVLFTTLSGEALNWTKNGATVPVTNYLSQWGLKSSIKPEAISEWTDSSGNLQGFPYDGFYMPVWYNTGLLAQAGVSAVPTTYSGFLDMIQKLKSAGVPAMVTGGSDYSGEEAFTLIAQTFMSPAETKKVFTSGQFCQSPDAMKGIQLFTQLRDAGLFVNGTQGFTADQMDSTFYAGKAAMMLAGSWAYAQTPSSLKVQLGGLPMPSGAAYTKPLAFQGMNGTGLWITPNGKKDLGSVEKLVKAFYTDSAIGSEVDTAGSGLAAQASSPVKVSDPLMNASVNSLSSNVQFGVYPDLYVGGHETPFENAVTLGYGKGVSATQICQDIEKAYKS